MQRILLATFAVLLGLPLVGQERTLDFLSGNVTVKDGLATVQLPEGYTFLEQSDARYVVEDLWGNAPDDTVVGLIVPPDLPSGEEAEWAIIVSFADDGYVSDDDAASLDFDDLLTEMKSDARAASADLREQGYAAADLLGWAEPPYYDSVEKKLYWAQRFMFDGDTMPTLNYNVRILGRRGYLVLNAVADDGMLPTISSGSKEILAVTEFTPGNRYSDFDPSFDKVAAYGIGGLIAGKLLIKAGLFKLLLKPLLILLALGAGVFTKVFKGRSRRNVVSTSLPPSAPTRTMPPSTPGSTPGGTYSQM